MEKDGLNLWLLFTQQPELWEGWDHAKTPIGFHDKDRAVLFGHPQPTEAFAEREEGGVRYHVASPKPVSFSANSQVDVGGVPTATVIWQERNRKEMLALISHEAFHAFQEATGCPFGSIALAMHYPVNDPRVQAFAEAEAKLLAEAVIPGSSREYTLAALDARAARQALLAPEVAGFEDSTELCEGLATYVELQSAGPDSQLWQTKVSALNRLNTKAWGADRLRFYYSGMAWGLLLDRWAPGWQKGPWRPLAGIVAEAMGHTSDSLRQAFPGLDFEEILVRQEREAGERKKEMAQILAAALPATGVMVDFVGCSLPVGGGWDPRSAVTFPGEGRFHPDGLQYIYQSGAAIKVGKNALEKEMCRRVVFEREDLNLCLDGAMLAPGQSMGKLEITGADCRLSVPRARVTFDGAALLVQEIESAKGVTDANPQSEPPQSGQ